MQNPIKTKITDIKFALKRLEADCLAAEHKHTVPLLKEAQRVLDEAIKSTDYHYQPTAKSQPENNP